MLAPTAAYAADTSYTYWGTLKWSDGDAHGNLHNEDNRYAYHGSYFRSAGSVDRGAYMLVRFNHWNGATFLGEDILESGRTTSTTSYAWGVLRSPLRSNGTDVTAWTRMCKDKLFQVDPCSTTVL